VEDGIFDDFMAPSLETCAQLSSLFEQATDEQLMNNNEAKVVPVHAT
jgi:hypothetical protein